MKGSAHSDLVTYEIVEGIEAVYRGEAEAATVHGQLQHVVTGLSPERDGSQI